MDSVLLDHAYGFASRPKVSTKCVVSKRYQKIMRIGHGSFGEVFRAIDKRSGVLVALKKLKITFDEELPTWASREIEIMQSVKHVNIVQLLEVCFITGYMGEIEYHLALEYCSHDLSGLIHNDSIAFKIDHIKDIMFQLYKGLDYLHTVRLVMHRDLKPANILVTDEGIIKISDFGLSREMLYEVNDERNTYTTQVCTLWYRAPEILLGAKNYGPAIDIWSTGLIMASLFNRSAIFRSNTEQGILAYISKLFGSITPIVWPGVDKLELFNKIILPENEDRKVDEILGMVIDDASALCLVDQLLVLDPGQRPIAKDVLRNIFFSGNGFQGALEALLVDYHGCDFDYFRPKRAKKRLRDEMEDAEREEIFFNASTLNLTKFNLNS